MDPQAQLRGQTELPSVGTLTNFPLLARTGKTILPALLQVLSMNPGRARSFFPLGCVLAAALTLAVSGRVALAQAPAPVEDPNVALFRTGIAAFEKGDYEGAITSLSQVIAAIGNPTQAALEPAYFDVAVAHYNLQRYSEAVTAFNAYRDKYPKGSRVLDATMSLANAYIGTKDYDGALKELATLESIPAQRDQVLFLRASILIEQKKGDDAISPLETLTADGLKNSVQVRGALLLTSLYVERASFVKANALIANIQRNLSLVDNILRFNGLIIQLGDKLLAQECYPQALELYHLARSRPEVIRYQEQRIATEERQIEENKGKFRASKDVADLLPNQMIFSAINEGKKMLDDIRNAPNFEPALLIRIARAYQQNDRPHEAALVYQRIVDKYPETTAEREPAMFGLIATLAESSRQKRALEACATYLKLFPAGANVSAVSYLRGAMALEAGDYAQAVDYFGSALSEQPQGTYSDRMAFLTGNAHFLAGDSKTAAASYEQYLSKFPAGDYAEEASYRLALCQMFTDRYEEAGKGFRAYMETYPKGEFAPDVRYRQAVIKYAAKDYEATMADCLEWLKEYADHRSSGEVYALLGDARAATDQREPAAEAYVNSYKAALVADNPEVLNYSLFEAGKALGKLGQWEKVAGIFEEFLKDHPDHPLAPAAVANTIQARSRLGQIDQAKAFAASAVARFIADPAKEATENLLTQLAGLCARRRQKDVDPSAELERLLTFPPEANVPDSPTVRARRLFAHAELMTFTRKPKEHDAAIYQIADTTKPGDLSPLLLGEAGEALLARDRVIPAREMFEQLIARYPKSDVLDFGYVGLGDLSFKAGDFTKALSLYNKAVEDIPSSYRLKEATVGKAKALLALNQPEEAAKIFEQIASTKEWRGESTAESLVSLGDIEVKRADFPKAIAYYQRVYVAWQKYPKWVARAYIESAHAFEKLGKSQEAVNTYREMLRNEKIADTREVLEARQRLSDLGQGS